MAPLMAPGGSSACAVKSQVDQVTQAQNSISCYELLRSKGQRKETIQQENEALEPVDAIAKAAAKLRAPFEAFVRAQNACHAGNGSMDKAT